MSDRRRSITLPMEQWTVQRRIEEADLTLLSPEVKVWEEVLGAMVVELRGQALASPIERVAYQAVPFSHPATWWDHWLVDHRRWVVRLLGGSVTPWMRRLEERWCYPRMALITKTVALRYRQRVCPHGTTVAGGQVNLDPRRYHLNFLQGSDDEEPVVTIEAR